MKDPAILFYTSDFISGTLTMTDEQRGQYIMLLCLQHQKGFLTEKDMLNICKTQDEDIWDKFKKNGKYYYNERMKYETEKRRLYSESRSMNRKGKVKKKKTYDKHMGNENEDENKDINIDENYVEIWNEWISYRKQIKKPIKPVSEQKAYDNLLKLSGNSPATARKIIDQSIANSWQGLFELKEKTEPKQHTPPAQRKINKTA